MVDDARLSTGSNACRIDPEQAASVSTTNLQNSGALCVPVCSEERHCRFCQEALPDWKEQMQAGSKQATPYMRVSFNGRTHKVPVKPGEQGQKEFAHAIRKLLNLPDDQEFDVSSF